MKHVITHRDIALVQTLQNVCFGKALLGQHFFKSVRSMRADADADSSQDSSKKNNPANQNEKTFFCLAKK